jgi:hypothetical protein
VDLIIDEAESLGLVEIKSAATVQPRFLGRLEAVAAMLKSHVAKRAISCQLVYGGSAPQKRSFGRAVPWQDVRSLVSSR